MNNKATAVVMGLGQFGGGEGATRFLLQEGHTVCVTDLQQESAFKHFQLSFKKEISEGKVYARFGKHELIDFKYAKIVIANPSIPTPWKNIYLNEAIKNGAAVTTELRLFIERLHNKNTIGITGSTGKSTTVAMLAHILKQNKINHKIGGNFGGSLLPHIKKIQDDAIIILELSSFMLWWLGESPLNQRQLNGWSPKIAAITNISSNHLDWHETEEHYKKSKQNIYRFQNEKNFLIGDDLPISDFSAKLPIPGKHNQINALLASTLAFQAAGISFKKCAESLTTFKGLDHRLQYLKTNDAFIWINDSKSTTPIGTNLAVNVLLKKEKNAQIIHLIVGGKNKQMDLNPISKLASKKIRLYSIGECSEIIGKEICPEHKQYFYSCKTLKNAVRKIRGKIEPNEIVLLSPGCASWDQFTNFEERGNLFKKLAQATSSPVNS